MKYFPVNQEIEMEINSIKKEIRLLMNGICAEQMQQYGVNYGQNFGVSWIKLRDLARRHERNYDIAERLWYMDIRETKLLATLLVPPEKFTPAQADEWKEGICTMELAEIISMTLLCKLPYAGTLSIQWINSGEPWVRLSAMHTAARAAARLSDDECLTLIHAITPDDYGDARYNHGIRAMLEYILLTHKHLLPQIQQALATAETSGNGYAQTVHRHMKDLIDML